MFLYVGTKTFPNNAAKYFTDGDGPDASLRLCKSHEPGASKVGCDFCRSCSLSQVVGERGEVFQQWVFGGWAQSIQEVLYAKS